MTVVCIRSARMEEAESLPAVERSAGELFSTVPGLAWIADDGVTPPADHRAAITDGTVWVAESPAGLCGFLNARRMGEDLYIAELSVRRDYQRRGIGRRLIDAAVNYARAEGLPALALTTFRTVSWNAPFYARLGFVILDDDAIPPWLASILAAETAYGMTGRCAMRRIVDPAIIPEAW